MLTDVTPLFDYTSPDGIRKITVRTSSLVCSSQIDIAVEGDVVRQVLFTNGCQGNTRGISALVSGMKVRDAINRLENIDCHGKGTSCPDQLAKALKLFL